MVAATRVRSLSGLAEDPAVVVVVKCPVAAAYWLVTVLVVPVHVAHLAAAAESNMDTKHRARWDAAA